VLPVSFAVPRVFLLQLGWERVKLGIFVLVTLPLLFRISARLDIIVTLASLHQHHVLLAHFVLLRELPDHCFVLLASIVHHPL
jgi:hypothetical protein